MKRTLLLGTFDEKAAKNCWHNMAAIIKKNGATDRLGVELINKSPNIDEPFWEVWLVDRSQ